MLPVLFRISIGAAWARPALAALVVAIALGRAIAYTVRSRRAGERVSLLGALWDDAITLVVLAAAAAALAASGYLDQDVSIPVPTYGALIALAFVLGTWLAQREAARQGQDPERIADLGFWVLVAALVGSHVYFVLVNAHDYFSPDTWLTDAPLVGRVLSAITFGAIETARFPRFLLPAGLVFYGGFIAAALTAAWYMRRNGMPFLPYADTMIPSVALGHFLGRLGCFSAGCCWGDVCSSHLPWAVRFGPGSLAYDTLVGRDLPGRYLSGGLTLPLHPTQLYEAFGELALFLLLVVVVRPRKRFHGQVLATWLVLYAVLRTVVESFRGDVERGVVLGLGVGQWTSAGILAAGVAIWLRARRAPAPAAELAT